jgi:eukaryotic-like serine/threonine-protein kinase
MIARTLAHYQITGKLGEGGMGVVYKARDMHLDRFVAVKVLQAEKVADPERKRRFVQEAKAASALNHPNIIHVYDIDQADGTDYIAMEYVDGTTLDQRIGHRGMRVNEVLKYSVQIADALTKAHSAGIIHRDLKPTNIMVNEDGVVKVLDFGLAKLAELVPGNESASSYATAEGKPITEKGSIVGTVSYMSPEQAEGKKVDARSDIFSFGAVLYEMATGRRAFHGDSSVSTLAAILNKDPKPASEIAPAVPRDLDKIINRCLRKDPERRFQNMADVKVALVELKEESESGGLGRPIVAERRGRWWWASAVALIAMLAAVSAWYLRRGAPESSMASIPLTTYIGSESMPTFSPDGNQVAFVWDGEKQDNDDIWVKLIGPGQPLRLTTDPAADFGPAWSPDGGSIAFLRDRGDKIELLLVPALGGSERRLAYLHKPADIEGPVGIAPPYVAWSSDAQWLAFPGAGSPGEPYGVFALSLKTGERRRLTSPPKTFSGDSGVAFSPDGRELVFVRSTNSTSRLYVLPLSQDLRPAGVPRLLPSRHIANLEPAWTADGREIIFFTRDPSQPRGLWRVAGTGTQEPQRLLVGDNAAQPAISRQGRRLAYTGFADDMNIWRLELSGRREAGPPVRLISSTRSDSSVQYSADGKKVVFASSRSGSSEIWMCDADGSSAVQLTSFGALSGTPRWSPDGGRIVFDSNKEGRFQIYVVDADGGVPRRLTDNPADDAAPSFSRDGKRIYFSSLRTGRWEVWKMAAEGGEPVQVTRQGGFSPFESADRQVLYYQKSQGLSDIWKAPVDGGEETRVIESVGHRQFAVVADGIYSIRIAGPGRTLQFFDFATGTTKDIAKLENPTEMGFTVSPDGRYVLYTQHDYGGSDLMLLENFQ